MAAALTTRSDLELLAVAEHLTALYDTRDLVLEDPDQLAAIDRDIEQYAQKFPDGFANFIKTCEAEQERLRALSRAVSRKQGMWAGREGNARQAALKVVRQVGKLQGSVFTLSEQSGREYVCVEDESKIPERFLLIIPERRVPDESRIATALKRHEVVPGARLERFQSYVVIR